MDVGFKITGLDELMKQLEDLSNPEIVQSAIQEGIMEGAKLVQNTAKMLCPVGNPATDPNSGALKNSISVTPQENGALVGSNMEYAPYVELGTGKSGSEAQIPAKAEINPSYTLVKTKKDGTSYDYTGMAPQPYLYPALKAHEKDIAELIKNKVQAKIKEGT